MTKTRRRTTDERQYQQTEDAFTPEGGGSLWAHARPIEGPDRLPTEAENQWMTLLGVRYEDGAYRCGDFRCSRLADALRYARQAAERDADRGR
ncbi:MAG: hypothetical protein ACJ8G7_19015 [Rhizobacter sp.]